MSQNIINVHQFASSFTQRQVSKRFLGRKESVQQKQPRAQQPSEIAAHQGASDSRFEVPKQGELSLKNQALHEKLTATMNNSKAPRPTMSDRLANG